MRFVPDLPKSFRTKDSPNSAKSQYMKALKQGSKKAGQQDAKERHNEIYKQKLNEVRNEAMKGAKYTFNLPGTDPSQCKELSKGAQEIIEKIAEKKAKRAEKKMKKADIIQVKAKYFMGAQGGRIDSKGNIYDKSGQCIMKVDKKTGKIKHQNGNTVGKYNPNCSYSEHRIGELISKYDTANNAGWYAGAGGHAGTTPADGVWGKQTESCGNGSIWGSSGSGGGGDIWGNKSDDKNGWW